MADSNRTPKDVLCLGCKVKFTLAADEFDSQVKQGTIEEHSFSDYGPRSTPLAKYTCHDCPHCRVAGAVRSKSPSVLLGQMATIRLRRIELESLGQSRSEAISTAVAEQMAADEREYAPDGYYR